MHYSHAHKCSTRPFDTSHSYSFIYVNGIYCFFSSKSYSIGRWRTTTLMLSKSKVRNKQWAIAMNNSTQTYRPFCSFCWPFQLAPVDARVPSSHWEGFKPGPEQAWLMLNRLALAYIHKPTEIDSRMGWINNGKKTFTFLTVREEFTTLNRES